jgi:translation initiation factor 2B subunit (eIF-2B alpha/beta/delta family)
VYGWCDDEDAPRDAVAALGANFIKAASTAKSVPELLTIVSELNKTVDQTGCKAVLARIQQYLLTEVKSKDFESHQCAFSEIGDGLVLYSKDSK